MTLQKPLRVCHVAYSFYESDNRVIRYAETLAVRGAHVDVLALRRAGQPSRCTTNGISIYGVQTRARNERAAWAYLLKILWFFAKVFVVLTRRGWGRAYDVVHVHNIPDFLVFAAAVPKFRGARLILDIHDVVPELYAGKFGTAKSSLLFRLLLWLERSSCRFADHVIVANHLWRNKLEARSVSPDRCSVILNYPDLDLFRADPSGTEQPHAPFVFLYPGTLNHHQGVDIAISAFAIAAPRLDQAEFHVYGDGPAREALRQQAAALGLGERVRLMDRVPLANVPGLMASAGAGVVPKRADGFGNEAFSTKILEFMACHVPVIASRTRIDAYYFGDDVVRFFTPGDPDDLARQMVWVYREATERRRMVESARGYVLENSWEHHEAEYVGIVAALTSTAAEPIVEVARR